MLSFDNQHLARLRTLVSSIFVSLSAGTNYAFSAYSPQLAQRLQLPSTALNAIGIAGNYGMYISSPFVGQIIDRIGPRRPLIVAAGLLCLGYGIVWEVFRTHPINPSDPAKSVTGPMTVVVLAFGMLCTGIGSSTALSSAAGGVARSFGPKVRATVMGFTSAGFGLAAFFWAGIGHVLFSDNTASFLLLLSLGTAGLILVGAFGLRIPDTLKNGETSPHLTGDDYQPLQGNSSSDVPSLPLPAQQQSPRHEQPTRELTHGADVDIYGRTLIKTVDFWFLWIVMGCCCGTSLMIINNIGTIVATLHFKQYHDAPNPITIPSVAHFQSAQVSLLSIFNCLGRVFAGTLSDTLQTRYGLPRVWWLCWISGLFLISQYIGSQIVTTLSSVSILTGLTGFAYGNMYGIGPILMLEWFGVHHFATNFGFLNLAPVSSSQIFNLAFGQIYDHHHRQTSSPGSALCGLGQECYRDAFWITIGACVLAMCLSGVLVYRHRPDGPSRWNRTDKPMEEETEQTWMLRSPSPSP